CHLGVAAPQLGPHRTIGRFQAPVTSQRAGFPRVRDLHIVQGFTYALSHSSKDGARSLVDIFRGIYAGETTPRKLIGMAGVMMGSASSPRTGYNFPMTEPKREDIRNIAIIAHVDHG